MVVLVAERRAYAAVHPRARREGANLPLHDVG